MSALPSDTLTQLSSALGTLAEAATMYRKHRRLLPVRQRLRSKLSTAFRVQAKVFGKIASSKISEAALWQWEGVIDETLSVTGELFAEALTPAQLDALTAGSKTLAGQVGTAAKIDEASERVANYLQEHGADMLEATTRDEMRGLLSKAVEEQWSYPEITDAIQEKFEGYSRRRAELIAETELANAYEAGKSMEVSEIIGEGVDFEKSWLTAGDEFVEYLCTLNEAAGWIPFDDEFPSGDSEPLAHPNCRCTALYQPAGMKESRRPERADRAALRIIEGDLPGHEFRGNQWTDGQGGGETFGTPTGKGETRKSLEPGEMRRGKSSFVWASHAKNNEDLKKDAARLSRENPKFYVIAYTVFQQGYVGGTLRPSPYAPGDTYYGGFWRNGEFKPFTKATMIQYQKKGMTTESLVAEGDLPGHEFRGNQWTGGTGGERVAHLSRKEKQKREKERKVERTPKNHAEVQREITKTCAKENFPTDRVIYRPVEGPRFQVGGKTCRSIAEANLNDGVVRVFAHRSKLTQEVVAHEVTHLQWDAIKDTYAAERETASKHIVDGKLDHKYADRFPVVAAMEKYLEPGGMQDSLREDDGVTGYSREWWAATAAGGRSGASEAEAISETLCEISSLTSERLRPTKEAKDVSPRWKRFHSDVKKAWEGQVAKKGPEGALPRLSRKKLEDLRKSA